MRRQAKAAFTLIELLVVIAIISVLASLLLPSLQGARNAAQSAACRSHLRQIAIATQLFASDNEGLLPTGPNWGGEGTCRQINSWHHNLTPWMDSTKSPGEDAWTWGSDYVAIWDGLICPAATIKNIQHSYGIHMALNSDDFADHIGMYSWVNGTARMIAQVRYPAEALAFMDENWDYSYRFHWVLAEARGYLYLEERFPKRHGGYNGCFVDGHVAAIRNEDIADPDSDFWRGF